MSNSNITLTKKAKQITIAKRAMHLMDMPETEFHHWLASLFSAMNKEAIVQVTHGTKEFGADLVVIRQDEFRKLVSAVVVKMGNIAGQTSGDVDNIISQISQCFDIPREIKSKIDLLDTNEVWLVLVGTFSGNARKRIRGQVKEDYKAILEIYESDWLVKNFTDYMPEIFLGGRAINFIGEEIERIEASQSLSKKATNLNLSEWFVDPYILKGGVPLVLDDQEHGLTINPVKMKFQRIRSLLKKENMVIISGDPGIGKTTALAKLCLDILREKMSLIIDDPTGKKIKIPVMLPAKELIGCIDFDGVIQRCNDLGKLTDQFDIETLIIDGLDEVPVSYRQGILDLSSELCSNFDCGLVVGTRKIDVIKQPPKGVKSYELAPLEISQAINLFEKLVRDDQLLNTLKEGLSKIQSQLPMTPVALILLIEIAEQEGEVPASLCDLYNRYIEMALGKWDIRDKDIKFLFQYEIKVHFLANLAYMEFYNKNKLEISREEFDGYIKTYAEKYGIDYSQIVNFNAEIERAGLLILKEIVSFRHRSFLDYFVALSIYNCHEHIEDINKYISDLYFGERWEDIAFFYIGLRKNITLDCLNALLQYQGDSFNIVASKYIIGRLLQAGWLTTVEIKTIGILGALDFAEPLKTRINQALENNSKPVGLIFSDFFLFMTAGWSLGSITLRDALFGAYTHLINKGDKESIQKLLPLFSTLQRYVSIKERENMANALLDKISNTEIFNTEERSRMLLLLILIEDRLGTLKSTVHKKCLKLAHNNRALFKRLLPPQAAPKVGRKRKRK